MTTGSGLNPIPRLRPANHYLFILPSSLIMPIHSCVASEEPPLGGRSPSVLLFLVNIPRWQEPPPRPRPSSKHKRVELWAGCLFICTSDPVTCSRQGRRKVITSCGDIFGGRGYVPWLLVDLGTLILLSCYRIMLKVGLFNNKHKVTMSL